jgi:hypothetical protein
MASPFLRPFFHVTPTLVYLEELFSIQMKELFLIVSTHRQSSQEIERLLAALN